MQANVCWAIAQVLFEIHNHDRKNWSWKMISNYIETLVCFDWCRNFTPMFFCYTHLVWNNRNIQSYSSWEFSESTRGFRWDAWMDETSCRGNLKHSRIKMVVKQWDDTRKITWKMIGNHQTSIKKWLFGVPGSSYALSLPYLIVAVTEATPVLPETTCS